MLAGPIRPEPGVRRRSSRPALAVAAASAVSEKLRLGAFARLYAAAGVVLVLLILYVSLSARVTQTSYDITRLQSQQADLVARQEQLRYKEANLQAPGQVEHDASVAGLRRGTATKYVQYQPVAVDLEARPGDAEPDRTPLWQQALAALVNGVSGAHDVMAAGN
jgi:hypothetical protein